MPTWRPLMVFESEDEHSPVVESLVADIRNDHLDTRICRNLFPSKGRSLLKSALRACVRMGNM